MGHARGQTAARRVRKSITYRYLASVISPGNRCGPPPLPAEQRWENVIRAAGFHAVISAVALRFHEDNRLPPEVGSYFRTRLVLDRERNAMMKQALEQVGDAINEVGVAPMLLKGAAHLATSLYPDEAIRFMGDLDVLLPESSIPAASASMQRRGFQEIRNTRYATNHRHPSVLRHDTSGIVVELHRYPVADEFRAILDSPALFEQAMRTSLGTSNFLVPSYSHSVLLTLIHGQLDDGNGARGIPSLRSLLDVAQTTIRFGESIEWSEIEGCLETNGYRGVVGEYVFLLGELMSIQVRIRAGAKHRAAGKRLDKALDRSPLSRVGEFLMGSGRWIAQRAPVGFEMRHLRALHYRQWKRNFDVFSRPW